MSVNFLKYRWNVSPNFEMDNQNCGLNKKERPKLYLSQVII